MLDWLIGGQTSRSTYSILIRGSYPFAMFRRGAEATIDLTDYGWVAGLLAAVFEVRSHSQSYREKLSDWKANEGRDFGDLVMWRFAIW